MSGNKGQPELDRMVVKIAHLDRLLSLTGEIIITASNISILQRHLQGQASRLDKDSVELVKNAALTAHRISSDLHHLVMDIRLIPIRDTFLRYRRLVRDLGRKKGKQINFEIVGEDTLVDKTVSERLYEPLAHQIRNAIDHGLEDPLERQSKGKDPTGRLTLTAYKKEGFTFISVEDDGAGLVEDRIRQAAVDKGLLTPQAAASLSGPDLFAMIMTPGFSTAREATETSGRGVGMDVVKSEVEELGGEILIESEPDKGSTFTYKIPQLSAVNITDALIIRAGEDFYAVPIGNVVATQAFNPEDLHTTMETSESILYLGSIVPLYDLRGLLTGHDLEDTQEAIPVIIIEAKNGRIALRVSEFIRPQKLVLIPLPDIFEVQGVSGTTILGGNQLGLVLEPFELINLAMGRVSDSHAEDRYLSRATVSFDDDFSGTPAESIPERGEDDTPIDDKDTAGPGPKKTEMDGRVAEEFFLEIQTILTDLNEEIFLFEKEPSNTKRVNVIFRYFHSIKGNLVMTGFTDLGGFVHEVESVLDRLRDGELELNEEIIDLLLDAVKTLETALARIRSGKAYEVEDQDLLAALEKYRRPEPEPEDEEEEYETFQLVGLSQLLLQAKRAQGVNVFQSLIRFKPRFQEPFLVAYLILRRLSVMSDVIDTVPPLSKLESGLVTDTIKVLFATTYSADDVNRFMERQLKRHYDVEAFDNLLME
jgi:chemotaxis protein histidine kinase CheA